MRTFTISKVGKSAYDYHRYLFVCEVIMGITIWMEGGPKEDMSFSHHQQGRIDFNTVNPSLPRGMDFLIHP